MKKYLSIILFSAIGGALTLGSYKLFIEESPMVVEQQVLEQPATVQASYLNTVNSFEKEDFTMVYYNADGNEGSMCGNGGRCLVAFAKRLNIIQNETTFDAVDGLHYATVDNGIVSLKMIDVQEISSNKSDVFLNTGSPHHIQFCENVSNVDVKQLGAKIRYGAPYFEEGTNVNFAEQVSENSFKVRTYERGVEDETLACGTGVTGVAIAANHVNKTTNNTILLEVLGGNLEVSFDTSESAYTNVFLKGPAEFVFEGSILI